MIAYFDASALVKLLVQEAGSDEVVAAWDGADAVVSSRVVYAEVRAALAAAQRGGRLSPAQHRRAKRLWAANWPAMRVVETGAHLDEPAAALAEAHALSGFDAIHLASALAVGARDMLIATWDARLHAAARALSFVTLPARL